MNTKVDDKYKISQRDRLNHKKDYFLLNGIPLRFDMPFNSFIDHSTYDLNEDFGANNRNYYLEEAVGNGKKIKYVIDVTGGIYNYSGGGHLMISDGLNQNNDSLIESISFGYVKVEK